MSNIKMKPLIVILGPTAIGKTRLAALLCSKFDGEIISADSRQVYVGMDIGTGKDLSDYRVGNFNVPYHLIDIIDPKEEFNLFDFVRNFIRAFREITGRGKIPFLTGGTALYIDAVLKRYELSEVRFKEKEEELEKLSLEQLQKRLLALKPNLHNKTDLLSKERAIRAIIIAENSSPENVLKYPDYKTLVIGVNLPREELKEKISSRLEQRLKNGMIEEGYELIKKGVPLEKLKFFGLEYKYVAMYINGEIDYNELFRKLNRDIAKFAKRQMTWFRKMEREGVKINWIAPGEIGKVESLIAEFLNGFSQNA